MSTTAKELREKRQEHVKEIRKLADKANDPETHGKWTSEDDQRWETVNNEYDDLSQRIERAERAETIEAEQERFAEREEATPGLEDRGADGRHPSYDRDKVITSEDRANVFQAWLRHGVGMELEDRHKDAIEKTRFNPRIQDFDLRLVSTGGYKEVRAEAAKRMRELRVTNYTATTDGQGGETVPPGSLVRQVELSLLAFGGMRQVSDVMRTASGDPLEWPTIDDTSNKGELLNETDQSSDSAVSDQNISSSNVTFNAYKISSKLIRITQELLEDNAVNLVQVIGDLIGERIARKENELYTTGTGSSQPNGIVTATNTGITAASTSAITADEIIDMAHSVDPAYRTNGRWMMNDSIVQAVRKLKDGEGQYLWMSGIQSGVPDSLYGYPMVVNQDMSSSLASSNDVMLFGDLSKYKIRDVNQMRMRRLVERYAEFDQEGFVAFHRTDGDLLDAGTDPVKKLTMSS